MASALYNKYKHWIGTNDWGADDLRVLLLDDAGSYTFSPDDDFVSDLTPGSNESTGTGYVRKTMGTVGTVAINKTADRAEFDCADPTTWTGADFGVVQAMIVFAFVTSDAASPLVAYLDGASFPVTTNSGDLTIQFDAIGVWTLT